MDIYVSEALQRDDILGSRLLIPFASSANQAAAVRYAAQSDRLADHASWICKVLLANTDRKVC